MEQTSNVVDEMVLGEMACRRNKCIKGAIDVDGKDTANVS